jgi:uncharacterized membrane protein YozB (DUF420 family)
MAAYLGFDIGTVALANLTLQTIVYFILILGYAIARKKRFQKHKKIMAAATLLNFISLFVVMLPVFYSFVYGISLPTINSTNTLVIVHHSIGLITLALASVVILKSCSLIKNTKLLMLTIFTLWSITYLLGVVIYLMFYTSLLTF